MELTDKTLNHKFSYNWNLADGYPEKNGLKVFSCFSCGGGSTMGYKLAGYDVIGCNEIDPKMMEVYKSNHNPKFSYLEGIQTFKNRTDLPEELFNLDILDGSPPCSSFSMAGNREKDWGKEKKFREGQAKQVLDTLFFDFIDLAERLQPKVVVAENVKGMLLGSARGYVWRIHAAFEKAGYYVKHFLLNSSTMGVPQKRERVFFVALRKDLATPVLEQVDMFTISHNLKLEFKEPEIPFGAIQTDTGREISEFYKEIWAHRQKGDADFSCTNGRYRNKPNTGFGQNYAYQDKVCNTLTSKEDCIVKFDYPQYLSKEERIKIQTFPSDYNFGTLQPHYLLGMSVPPIMMAQIATKIKAQLLDNIVSQEETLSLYA